MKNTIKAVIAFALAVACAGTDDFEPDGEPFVGIDVVEGWPEGHEDHEDRAPAPTGELGTLGQPIFMPLLYGSENGTEGGIKSPECSPPWAGAICTVPDSKHIKIGFQAGTCSSWYQARVFSGHATWQLWINNLGDDWGTSTGSNYQIKCGTIGTLPDGSKPFATFENNDSDVDTHPTEHGTLMQFRKGTIVIDPSNIETWAGWGSLSEASKQRVVDNAVKHELGHLVGFGHNTGNNLMGYGANFSSTVYSYNSSMTSRAQCYNEDSGTSDDC